MSDRVKNLIDKAADVCGSKAATAERLGISRHKLGDYQAGTVPMPAHVLARLVLIADLSSEEARELLAELTCASPKNSEFQGVLRRAFFACLAIGAALVSPDSNASQYSPRLSMDHCLYIVHCLLLKVMRGFGWRRRSARLRPRSFGHSPCGLLPLIQGAPPLAPAGA